MVHTIVIDIDERKKMSYPAVSITVDGWKYLDKKVKEVIIEMLKNN